MIKQEIIEKMIELHLSHMASIYKFHETNPNIISLTFDERFELLINSEYDNRRSKRINSLIKGSNLKEYASLEDIDYSNTRGLNKGQITALGKCDFIVNGHNIIINGPTGTGKTYLACAFGTRACENNYKVLYFRLSRLLNDLEIAKKDYNYNKLLTQLKKANVLIIDDFAMNKLTVSESRNLLEVIDDRSKYSSLILASQVPSGKWYETFEDPTYADAIMDRIIHNAYQINLKGPSMRKVTSTIMEM